MPTTPVTAGPPPANLTAVSLDSARRHLQQQAPWLLTASESTLARLCHQACLTRLPRGGTLLQAGQAASQLHLVLVGRLHELSRHQGRNVLLQVLRPGDVAGETDVLSGDDAQVLADCVAVHDSLLLSLSAADLFAAMDQSTVLRQSVMARQVRRLRMANARVRQLATMPVLERIVWVAQQACEQGAALSMPGLNRNELAGLAGASREATSRAVCQLLADGRLVEWGRLLAPPAALKSHVTDIRLEAERDQPTGHWGDGVVHSRPPLAATCASSGDTCQ